MVGATESVLDDERHTAAEHDLAAAYLRRVAQEVTQLQSQLPAIWRAGYLLAESWRAGGVLWVSEANHTLHGELVERASGPVAARKLDTGASILDPVPVRDLEGVQARDVVLLHSNVGTSHYEDTVTTMAHARGAKVIALTQAIHALSGRLAAKGSSGRPLLERADVTVDIGGAFGDGALRYAGVDVPICPLSGAVGLPAAWAIVAHAAEILGRQGVWVPFRLGGPFPGGKEHTAAAVQRWRDELRGAE